MSRKASVGAHPGMPGSLILLQFGDAAIPTSSTSTLCLGAVLEEVADVRRYKLVFEHLRAVAASPEASVSPVTSASRGGEVREAVLHGRAEPRVCRVVQEQL
jgi:hypothetical protein